jgi:hypothetical protein
MGSALLDQQTLEELAIQRSFWGYSPAFSPFLDCSGANAFSSPEGFIVFGVNLAYETILHAGTTLPLAGILAHEWAHQIQFARGYMDSTQSTVRNSELEADAFSGLYMRYAKSWVGPQMQSYFDTLFRLGDYNFNHPSHHGTPNMRVAAGVLGMMAADEMIAGVQMTYDDLHQQFQVGIAEVVECAGPCRDPLPTALRSVTWPSWLTPERVEFIARVRDGEASISDLDTPAPPYDGRSPILDAP